MSKLADIAKKSLGTQTIKLDEVIEQFGGVVTINDLSYVEYKGDRIPVFGFVEGEGASFWGGCKKLRELAADLEEAYGDLRAINEAFQAEGLRIKINPLTKTKTGSNFRPVNVLGTVKFDDITPVNHETGEVLHEIGEIEAPDDPPF